MPFRRGGASIATLAMCAERQDLAKRHEFTRAARHGSQVFNSLSYSERVAPSRKAGGPGEGAFVARALAACGSCQ